MIRSLFIKKKEKVTKKERGKKEERERVHSELMKLLLFFFLSFLCFQFSLYRRGVRLYSFFLPPPCTPTVSRGLAIHSDMSRIHLRQDVCSIYAYTDCTRWCQERRKAQDGGVPPVCNIHEVCRKWLSQKFLRQYKYTAYTLDRYLPRPYVL